MVNLENLVTSEGVLNIIEETAHAYHEIGTNLLNDRNGRRVGIIESNERGNLERIMREIYKQWIAEDKHHSWTTMIECFRVCKLETLASTLEHHFGLSSPVQGTILRHIIYIIIYTVHVVCEISL